MQSKFSWVLPGVLAVGLALSFVAFRSEKARRAESEARAAEAAVKAEELKAAAEKAVAARQEAEAARQKFEADLSAIKTELAVAKGQAAEMKEQLPKFRDDASQLRKALAEMQRAAPAVPAGERPQPAAMPKHNNGGWSVADVLPADSLGVLTIRDIPVTIEKAKGTGLWRILSSPEFERVFKWRIAWAQGYLMLAELMSGEKLADILALLSEGEITLGVLGIEARGPGGQPIPDIVLSVQVRDKANAFTEKLNTNLDRLKALANNNLTVTQTKIGNTPITQLRHPQVPTAVNFGIVDGTFVLCTGEGRIEKLLAMREATKNGGAPDAANGPQILMQNAAYKRALEKAGADADALVFVNVQAIAANRIVAARELNPTQKHELEMSGLNEVQAAAYAIGVAGAGVRESLFLDVPANKRHGVIGLIDGESADLKGLYSAPRNSIVAATFKVSPDKLLDRIVELAAMNDPAARENVAAALFFIGDQLKIDVKRDLLEALTGQGVFSLCIPAKNAKLPLAFPQPILSFQIRNREGLQLLLKSLATQLVDKIQVTELKEGEKYIEILRQRLPDEGKEPAQICYVIDGNDLILSLYPLALRDELKRRASDTAKLENDPDFNQARAAIGAQPQAMFYVDMAALVTAAYDIAVPLIQLRERNAPVDVNALPSGELLNQNLGSALYGLQFAADGIQLEVYSPAGGVGPLVLAGAAAGQFARTRQMQAQDQVAQAQAQAQGARNRLFGGGGRAGGPGRDFGIPKVEAQKVDTLGKVYRDLKEYATEHGGNFPAKLEEMKPKYLQDIGNELEIVVYRGKQAADNLVLAHSSEKLPGPISILLQNGTIQSLQRQLLGEVLKDGFTDKILKADPNGAVKPPKPPEF